MHRNNKYKESPPDFSLLASLYPSFSPYLIFPSSSDRPTIDFTDFSATRELTRVLLLHDHGVNWFFSSALFLFNSSACCVSDEKNIYFGIPLLVVWS
jgi:RNA methyltransferase